MDADQGRLCGYRLRKVGKGVLAGPVVGGVWVAGVDYAGPGGVNVDRRQPGV